MTFPLAIIFLLLEFFSSNYLCSGGTESKLFIIDGQEIKVTHQVNKEFLGRYSGRKGGYLMLSEDGTGKYLYDETSFFGQNCEREPIEFEWGFIINENGQVVKFEREYGYSYPIIYRATGEILFQGCLKAVLVDYILVKKNGVITISSSSDWNKE